MKSNFKLGILGGMGPEATIMLYQKIVEKSKKHINCDQDHIHTIITSNTCIPDRTDAILNNGKSPVPEMVESIRILESAGVSLVVIPCNTAHFFLSQLASNSKAQFLDMLLETTNYLVKTNAKKVGLLATDGTINSKIYEKYLSKVGVELIIPSTTIQRKTMSLIYGSSGIKSGFIGEKNKNILQECIESLKQKGVDKVILGCTEFCLVAPTNNKSEDFLVEPMDIATDYIINNFYTKDK